ncbi:MAG TPA: HAD hydrolase-like protein, partial [Caldilineaceae bacterium]|nr:HAD hydrolase-like protein [Caldilineaceae bacterium]
LLLKLEGPVNWWIGILLWVQLYDDLERMTGFLNRARAFPQANQLALRPGVADLLRNLSRSYHMGLLTSRPRADVDCFLERAGLSPTLFSAITAQADPRSATSPSEALALAMKGMGVTAGQVIVVGDSEWKLRPAQAFGAVRCGVLGGLAVASDFADADLVLEDLGELADWL